MASIVNINLSHPELLIEYNKDLQKYSTMRLVARGDLITVKGKEGLKYLLRNLSQKKISYKVLGWGANILLPEVSSLPYVQLDFEFDRTIFDSARQEYLLPASVSLATLTSHASRFGLKGWEVFTGIPASLGGAIYMNAGTNLGEIGSIVKEVKVVDRNGQEKVVPIDKNSFSYRKNHFLSEGDVICEARLIHFGIDQNVTTKIKEYLDLRNKTQPLKEWTCGCVFKNYQHSLNSPTCRAGHFIDIIGLKGLSVNGLQISPKHANFMENRGGSTYSDVLVMIDIIKTELKLQFGVDFEIEVEY